MKRHSENEINIVMLVFNNEILSLIDIKTGTA